MHVHAGHGGSEKTSRVLRVSLAVTAAYIVLLVVAGKLFREPNKWPDGLPGFRALLLRYWAAMEAFSQRLLPVCATALDLPPNYFDAAFVDAAEALQVLQDPLGFHVGLTRLIQEGAHVGQAAAVEAFVDKYLDGFLEAAVGCGG